jgi:DNA-binding response OmpR family regulator
MARKVIFATGDLVAHDTTAFLESTGNTYLEKPFSIRSIVEALRQLEE